MTASERRPATLRTPRVPGETTRTHRGSIRSPLGEISTFQRGKRPSPFRGTLLLGVAAGVIALMVFLFGGGSASVAPEGSQITDEVTGPAIPAGPPTPFFARYRSLQLALPVAEEEVTLLAFHQASGQRALSMEPLVPLTDMDAMAERVKDLDFTTSAALAEENGTAVEGQAGVVWVGEALQLWRSSRRGPADTAADVGAAPGTEVRAPVSGTVIRVRRYYLYDQYEDYEIHIQPDGWPEVDVVLIHVTDPVVAEGDVVVGGVTPVASVRQLSDKVELQLSGYTEDGGDHVHMQLNELPDPAMLDMIGES